MTAPPAAPLAKPSTVSLVLVSPSTVICKQWKGRVKYRVGVYILRRILTANEAVVSWGAGSGEGHDETQGRGLKQGSGEG